MRFYASPVTDRPVAPISGREAAREGSFRKAVEIARRQGAKSLQLRAAVSLGRLLRRQGKGDARAKIADVYASFTEGFDTVDLKEAAER